jgi:hypothetical protein
MSNFNDLAYIQNPLKWVSYLCPMKRRVMKDGKKVTETAYLADKQPILYHGNMFNPQPTDRAETFSTHSQILAEGWVVD